MSDTRIEVAAPSRLRQSVALAIVSIGGALAACLAWVPKLPPEAAACALLLYGAVGATVANGAGDHLPFARFGLANWITLGRAAGAALLGAVVLAPDLLAAAEAAWAAVALAVALLALDGFDGWAARRQRLCSRFGARFDMEVDALLILVLCALALALGKAGPWVLALGLMRYGFLAAAQVVPRLREDLFPSRRRKAVCVLQIAVLTAILAPPVGPRVAGLMAAGALAALVWSFAVDVWWLARRGR
jgi:phosphatidylglycerophosphate synthase